MSYILLYRNSLSAPCDFNYTYFIDINTANAYRIKQNESPVLIFSNPCFEIACDSTGQYVYIYDTNHILFSNDYGNTFINQPIAYTGYEAMLGFKCSGNTLFYLQGTHFYKYKNGVLTNITLPPTGYTGNFFLAGLTFDTNLNHMYFISDWGNYDSHYPPYDFPPTDNHTLFQYNDNTATVNIITTFPLISIYYICGGMVTNITGQNIYVCIYLPTGSGLSTTDYGIYVSNDFGNTWNKRLTVNQHWSQTTCSSSGKYVYASMDDMPGGIYMSSDYGNTWQLLLGNSQNGFSYNQDWMTITASCDGTTLSGIYRSASTLGYFFQSNIIVFKFPIPIGNICFSEETIITTDQGFIEINKIIPFYHSINNKQIKAVTKIILGEEYAIFINKDAIEPSYPNKDTIITANHLILVDNELIPAINCIMKNPNKIKKIPYKNNYMYNILLDDYSLIKANGLITETLHPKNEIAIDYLDFDPMKVDDTLLIEGYN